MAETENEKITGSDGFKNVEGDGDLFQRLLWDGFGGGVMENCSELHGGRR